jgi:hypothetical protein
VLRGGGAQIASFATTLCSVTDPVIFTIVAAGGVAG